MMDRAFLLRVAKIKHLAFATIAGVLAPSAIPADATGTVQVRQSDGSSKTYKTVTVKVNASNMAIISADGAGMFVIGKSSCSRFGELVRCLPYDGLLYQYGRSYHIALKNGTLWVNPTQSKQKVPSTSTQLPPRGVLLSMRTKAGTNVSLNGTVDEMQK
jgi:hypothetical protein